MAGEGSLRRWQREDAARKIEVAYLTDETRRPVEYWWEVLGKDHLKLPEIRQRALAGRWAARRAKLFEGIEEEVLRKSRNRVIHDRVAELQQIQQVRADIVDLVTPEVFKGVKTYRVKPSSYEGLVGALVKIDMLADAKRDVVLRMIEPDLAVEVQKGPEGIFAPEELRGVARMLLESRRRKQLGQGDQRAQQEGIDQEAADQEAEEAIPADQEQPRQVIDVDSGDAGDAGD
jgi:hypothetical protein